MPAHHKHGWLMGLWALGILLAGCAGQKAAEEAPCTVAVWELENLSPTGGTVADVGSLLTDRVMEKMQTLGRCEIVERQKLLLALEELHLGASQLADEATRLRIGRIVGARRMVFGTYQLLGTMLRIDLRLVDVASGRILKTAAQATEAGDISQWMQTAEQAAMALVES